MEAKDEEQYLEWIDPRQPKDIKHIADEGFGSVYLATWLNPRTGYFENVALRITNTDIGSFLNEVEFYYFLNWFVYFKCRVHYT
jgi:hypothetical protein